jgi:hypothetical protein
VIGLSRTALRDDRTSAPCVALADALAPVAPARVTSLVPAHGSGHTRLEGAVRPLVVGEPGELLIDDAGMATPLATALQGLAGVCSRRERRPVEGCSLVVVGWPEGVRRLPLGRRLWPTGGPSPSELAWAWLSEARPRWRCRPASVRFDAGDPSRHLLKRLGDAGWSGVGRLTKHRRVNGQPLRAERRHRYGAEPGRWRGGLQVLVGSDGAKDDATTRRPLPAAEVRRRCQRRAHIAAVIRVCNDQRGLSGCHARSERAPWPPSSGGFLACGVREGERQERGGRIDHRKRRLSGQGRSMTRPARERLRSAA